MLVVIPPYLLVHHPGETQFGTNLEHLIVTFIPDFMDFSILETFN